MLHSLAFIIPEITAYNKHRTKLRVEKNTRSWSRRGIGLLKNFYIKIHASEQECSNLVYELCMLFIFSLVCFRLWGSMLPIHFRSISLVSESCITTPIWHCRKPISQWQCSFDLKAVLPLDTRFATLSVAGEYSPWTIIGLCHAIEVIIMDMGEWITAVQ